MQKLKQHPDLGGNDSNAIALNQAYATLSNEAKRAAYDSQLQNISLEESRHPNQWHKRVIDPVLCIAHDEPQCLFCGSENPDTLSSDIASICATCGSPLKSSTSHLQSVDVSGRSLERQLRNAPIKYFTEARKPAQFGILLDLSPLGLRFQLSEPLENDQTIKLVCDALTAVVKVKNCMAHITDGHYVVGVEFLTSRFNKRRGTFFSEAVS